jgi:PPOX class probable F420-dependent enzyme
MGINQRSSIVMSDAEVSTFIEQSRTATLATIGANGLPHLVAMWYGWIDGAIYFETKAKSQKAVNLRRDPRAVVSIEAGKTYDQLRGVAIEGDVTLIDDTTADEYWAAAINVYERYNGPYSPEVHQFVEIMMNKRIIVRIDPTRVRSWDHRKMGMAAMPLAGTTAEFVGD